MKHLLSTLFPIKLQLNILQLNEYNSIRFIKWLAGHFTQRNTTAKKPLVVTSKIKKILLVSILLDTTISLASFALFNSIAVFFGLYFLLLTQPYILFLVSLAVIRPYEIWNKRRVISATRNKILEYKKAGLKVIAITGSYGKTSTKEILYQLIKDKYRVLRTPESFNTVFGIAKVVDLELDDTYDFFICEMAAYTRGEIKTLAHMAPPDYGIITGIAPQHLERFGSIKNIVSTKFELYDAVKNMSKMFVNMSNENVRKEVQNRNGNPTPLAVPTKISLTDSGSTFWLNLHNKSVKFTTTLFGYSSVKNIATALSVCSSLGLRNNYLIPKVKTLSPFSSRMVLRKIGRATIIDNTYSSNLASFEEIIHSAQVTKGKKVIVTPGIVELGSREEEIHENIGVKLKTAFDFLVLVGKNKRTSALAKGFGENLEYIKDERSAYQNKINELCRKFDWVFLENDVTQNY